MEQLERIAHEGAALVGSVAGPVRFGFTERGGGVSRAPYASLNLGLHVGDDARAVAENRRRALALLGAEDLASALFVPRQVHGNHVVVLSDASPAALRRAHAEAERGADAVVCSIPEVPVLLNFADCVPVILTCGDAFAVVHSGWKGTYARVALEAARTLAEVAGRPPGAVRAYIGPHITGAEYEVSADLLDRFEGQFGEACHGTAPRMLDLSACIRLALVEAGVPEGDVFDTGLSTVSQNDRFFSYRAEGGVCGRHGAVAVLRPDASF